MFSQLQREKPWERGWNISRSPPTLMRVRMPYFLALVSHVRTSQAYGCAYDCAYRTSENQA